MSGPEANHGGALQGRRIIVVIGPLDLGGAERQAILVARHLAYEQQADVEVWGYGPPGRAAELCDDHGLKWRSMPLPIPWSYKRSTQIRRLVSFALALRRARPDVILPFMFFQSVACGIVWRFTGARTCIWNQRDEGRDQLGRWQTLAVRRVRHFVANSSHGARFLIEKAGAPPERVRVIHNGVAPALPERDRQTWRNDLGLAADDFVACMVANLQTFKDHVTLLKAWRIVVDRVSPSSRRAMLLLAGRFDETAVSLKLLAFDLGLSESVRFLGPVKDVSGLLNAVDLGVHSSINEGCPNAVLECMAAGLAVVGTDYEGIREAVGPDNYQFLAAPGDPQSLADRIVALMDDEGLRQEVGVANRLRVQNEFNPRMMCEKLVSLIAEDLSGSARSVVKPAAMLASNQKLG